MSEYNDNSEDTRECEAMRKMFVGGINRDTKDEDFFDHFAQYGHMVDKVVIKDPNTKSSRGFGFITYDASDSVENVFQARPHELDGKTLDVKRAMPRDDTSQNAHATVTKLFIGGVAADLEPADLQKYIEGRHPTSIGTVSEIKFMADSEGHNKGFGFLECSDNDFADRLAISESNFEIKGKKMSLKKAKDGNQGQGGRGGRGGFRGGFRGNTRGGSNRGGGFSSRGNRGGYGDRNGYNSGSNYNNQGGYQQQQQQQQAGGYGGGGYQQGGYGGGSYQQGGYTQGGGYQASQYGGGQYNQNQSYGQGSYDQSNNQANTNNQSYGGGNQAYGNSNQQGGNNRFQPY